MGIVPVGRSCSKGAPGELRVAGHGAEVVSPGCRCGIPGVGIVEQPRHSRCSPLELPCAWDQPLLGMSQLPTLQPAPEQEDDAVLEPLGCPIPPGRAPGEQERPRWRSFGHRLGAVGALLIAMVTRGAAGLLRNKPQQHMEWDDGKGECGVGAGDKGTNGQSCQEPNPGRAGAPGTVPQWGWSKVLLLSHSKSLFLKCTDLWESAWSFCCGQGVTVLTG